MDESSFRATYERTPFMAYAVDGEHRITAVTDFFLERMGYARAEVVGRRSPEFITETSLEFVKRVALPRLAREGAVDDLPLELVTKGGATVPVLFSARRLLDASGASAGAAGTLREPAGEHRSMLEMQREKLRFQALTDALPFFVARIDGSLRYRFVNESYARMFGRPVDQIVGRPVAEFVAPEVIEDLLPRYERVMAGETMSWEQPSRFVDGRELQMRLTYLPDPVTEDGPGMFFVGHDVTEWVQELEERSALEAQVLKAQHLEALGLLAGGVAHDFNNLLTGILGNSEAALLDLGDHGEAVAALKDVITAAKRASELTRQLLTYAGRQETKQASLDLNELASEVLQLLRHQLDGLVVLKELDAGNPDVLADRAQLGRILMNLVTNAADAMGGAGRLTVRTGTVETVDGEFAGADVGHDAPAGVYGWVEVQDTGGGIPAEHRERIFEPFFSTKPENHGLGLADLSGSVRAQRGVLEVRTRVGEGTRFRVYLPRAVRSAPPTPVPRSTPLQGRALLADDQPLVLRSLKRQLVRLGLEVTTAGDGAEAVGAFERDPAYDLVVLDVVMPVMDGPTAMRRMRELRSDVPIVLLSGFHDRELDVQEADAFLPKPCSAGALRTVLADLLA